MVNTQKIKSTLDPGTTPFMLFLPLEPGTMRAYIKMFGHFTAIEALGNDHLAFFLRYVHLWYKRQMYQPGVKLVCIHFLILRMPASVCVSVC